MKATARILTDTFQSVLRPEEAIALVLKLDLDLPSM